MKQNTFIAATCLLSAVAFGASASAQTTCTRDNDIAAIVASLKAASVSGSAGLLGISEYANPTSPLPKKYRHQDLSGMHAYVNRCSTNPQPPINVTGSGYLNYDAISGAVTNTQSSRFHDTGSGYQFDTVNISGTNFPQYGSRNHTFALSDKTTFRIVGDEICQPDNFNVSGTVEFTLSDEDTEKDAEKRFDLNWKTSHNSVAWDDPVNFAPATFPLGAAFSDDRGNGFTWSFKRIKYLAEFDTACEGEYDVVVSYSSKLRIAPYTVGNDVQVVRKTLKRGRHTISGEIRSKARNTDYTLQSIVLRTPCGNKPAGSPDFSVKSIHAEMSLGLGARQESAGFLRVEAATLTADLYTPSALVVATPDSGVDSILDSSGKLRQVKAPQALVDIVTLNSSMYEVRYYSLEDVGTQDESTRVYAVSGTPYVTFKFENPDTGLGLIERLRITETRGSNVRVHEYAYSASTSIWSLSQGNDLRRESVEIGVAGPDTTKVSTILDADQNIVRKAVKKYHAFPWGEELVSEVLDPDGTALATSYSFYENASTDGGAYGRLKLRTDSNGSWERRTYDSSGRILKTVRPHLNAIPTDAIALCRVTENAYTTLADQDGDSKPEQLTATTESILGVEVTRTYSVEWSNPVSLSGEAFSRRSDIRANAPGAAWNAAGNLVTDSLLYNTEPYLGRIRRVLNPDGTGTFTRYALDGSGVQTAITETGVPNQAKTAITEGTRTVIFTSAQGQVVGEAVTDIASGQSLLAWTATQFDNLGRPTRFDHVDGTYETRDYACCGLASSRDRTGLVSSYEYDALGRQTNVTLAGITTRTAYDADGRVKSVTRIGSDNSEIIQSSSTYNLAGRLTEHRDALDRVTGYAEVYNAATGNTTRTTTHPDTGTVVEVSARDGSRLSVGGTAAAPRNYEYGIEAGQLFTKETFVGESGAITEWRKTFTDFVGRTYKTVLADGATSESFFNALGQLVRQVDPDGVTTLLTYNAKGEQEVTALDLNANGTIDYSGTDRISKVVNTIGTRDTFTVQRSTTQVWETNEADTPVTVSIHEQGVDGLHSWQTIRGLTTATATVLDGSGNRTVTSTGPDGVKNIQVYTANQLVSSVAKAADDVQLAAVTYGYDPHGRLQTSTDARTGATSYTYFDDDQIHTVTTPDPDATRSGAGYDPQTTTYAYNSAGRLETVTQPDGTVVNTTYYVTGAVKRTWGSRTYPSEYAYDPQGRVKSLTTWQDFAGDTGQAVTTWNYSPTRGLI